MVYPVSPCRCLPDCYISVRLGREPFSAVRSADGPSRALYPPYLLLGRLTPGDFESAPFDVIEVGGRGRCARRRSRATPPRPTSRDRPQPERRGSCSPTRRSQGRSQAVSSPGNRSFSNTFLASLPVQLFPVALPRRAFEPPASMPPVSYLFSACPRMANTSSISARRLSGGRSLGWMVCFSLWSPRSLASSER